MNCWRWHKPRIKGIFMYNGYYFLFINIDFFCWQDQLKLKLDNNAEIFMNLNGAEGTFFQLSNNLFSV